MHSNKIYFTSRASATIADAIGQAALVPSNPVVQSSLGSAVLWGIDDMSFHSLTEKPI